MTATKILGMLSTVFIVGFMVFAFRQGLRVKPDDRPDRGPRVDTGGDGSGHLP